MTTMKPENNKPEPSPNPAELIPPSAWSRVLAQMMLQARKRKVRKKIERFIFCDLTKDPPDEWIEKPGCRCGTISVLEGGSIGSPPYGYRCACDKPAP